MSAPTRPVLRYHGGKFRLAPWIISHFPAHRLYIEPFGGAASVFMRKPRSHTEVYNDVDEEIVNVFRVLRDPARAAQLEELVRLTPFARAEFGPAYEPTTDLVEQARRTVVKAFFGFGSDAIHRPGPRGFRQAVSTRLSMASPARDWANWPDAIAAFVERLRGVTLECRPALEIIPGYDYSDTLYYIDPPYPASTRGSADPNGYRHELTDAEHGELADALSRLKGMVVLSGYACELYDQLYASWPRARRASFADGARKRTEVLWLNPAAARAQQSSLFAVGTV